MIKGEGGFCNIWLLLTKLTFTGILLSWQDFECWLYLFLTIISLITLQFCNQVDFKQIEKKCIILKILKLNLLLLPNLSLFFLCFFFFWLLTCITCTLKNSLSFINVFFCFVLSNISLSKHFKNIDLTTNVYNRTLGIINKWQKWLRGLVGIIWLLLITVGKGISQFVTFTDWGERVRLPPILTSFVNSPLYNLS